MMLNFLFAFITCAILCHTTRARDTPSIDIDSDYRARATHSEDYSDTEREAKRV